MQLKDYIQESLNKEYTYRVRLAADCGADHMNMLEQCLQKYELVSAAPWKRTPIEENPAEFHRIKGLKITSEVCSTDVILKYPVNERILEVWLAVNLGVDPQRVIVYGIKEARRAHIESDGIRAAADKDRYADMKDSVLMDEDQSHYDVDTDPILYGEKYNERFLKELAKVKADKGADYFRAYPTKSQIMGDENWAMWDQLHNGTNMGRGTERKEVDVISQSSRRN